jgi:hypothetical protein
MMLDFIPVAARLLVRIRREYNPSRCFAGTSFVLATLPALAAQKLPVSPLAQIATLPYSPFRWARARRN